MIDVETFNDALIECVKAAGGSKKVGEKLWPEKPVETAQRQLLACLNEDRPEKLTPDQALLIMRLSKEAGSQVGIQFICESLSYSIPTPINPEDQTAQLQREFISAVSRVEAIAARIGKVGQ
jgi:hypothetical protein